MARTAAAEVYRGAPDQRIGVESAASPDSPVNNRNTQEHRRVEVVGDPAPALPSPACAVTLFWARRHQPRLGFPDLAMMISRPARLLDQLREWVFASYKLTASRTGRVSCTVMTQ